MSSTHNSVNTRLIPLSKWNEYHDYPTVSSLRHLVFFEEQNGFSVVIKRIGKKIYLDERRFFDWVDEQNSSGKQTLRPSCAEDIRRSYKSES
jgi:hypothetical protein